MSLIDDSIGSLFGGVADGLDAAAADAPDDSFFGHDAAVRQTRAFDAFSDRAWEAADAIRADPAEPTWERDLVALSQPAMAFGLGALGMASGIATVLRDPALIVQPLLDPVGTVEAAAQGVADYFATPNPFRQMQSLTANVLDPGLLGLRMAGGLGRSVEATAFDGLPSSPDAGVRWRPDPGDTRFSLDEPPVLGIAEYGFNTFQEAVGEHFQDRGGILMLSGPSGVGKGYTTEHLMASFPDRHFQVLEQDWFMASPETRSALVRSNLDKVESSGGVLQPSEWRGFWDHGRVQDTLGQIRSAFDAGLDTEFSVANAWHRSPNEAGLNLYDEPIRITPQTIVIFDAKYPVNSLPDGRRFDDMSVRLEDDPANVRAKYEQRTRKDYPDPAVQQAKLAAYDTVYAPSYQRFLGLQQQYALDRPGSPSAIAPDLILNVDLNHVPAR